MSTRYHCPECHVTLTRFEVIEETEYVTSEFWAARSTQRSMYLVCGLCGSDVEEVTNTESESHV